MKRLTILLATAAAALAAVPAAAQAAPAPKAQATVLGTVVDHGDGSASVTARYVCPEGFHLWVSAKQAADGRPDQRLRGPGSSALSSAWYDAHPKGFTCDGKQRTQTFTITNDHQGFGELVEGSAWIQFCLVGAQTFLSESRWVAVREA